MSERTTERNYRVERKDSSDELYLSAAEAERLIEAGLIVDSTQRDSSGNPIYNYNSHWTAIDVLHHLLGPGDLEPSPWSLSSRWSSE